MRRALGRALLGLTLATVFLGSSVAFAYIPPAQFIIKNMTTKRSGIHSIRVSSVVMPAAKLTGPGARNAVRHFKVVTIYDSSNRTMLSQAFDPSGALLYGIQKKDAQLPLSLMVLYDAYYADLVGALKRAAIPVSTDGNLGDAAVSLQRWNGSIAWALGLAALPAAGQQAQSHDAGHSELWVEKDSFLPVRLIVGDEDIQFVNYRYSQELPYPRTTTIANRAGEEQLEENIQSLQTNPSAATVEKMKSEVAPGGSPGASNDGFTSAGDSSGLKDLIRSYYAGIR